MLPCCKRSQSTLALSKLRPARLSLTSPQFTPHMGGLSAGTSRILPSGGRHWMEFAGTSGGRMRSGDALSQAREAVRGRGASY